ncbi:MAG: zinc ABC transporter substrate-binding protein [Candidatus Omnitrophica bacterium]|nr:zinc ABC transporter substrate-binding protein [Candidatus Omnitrophota bacterium]
MNWLIGLLLWTCAASALYAEERILSEVEGKPLKVVATLSTFADLAKTVGGDRAEVATIASPRFNPHFIEPKPSDVLKVKRAELFIHAGLDLELWRWPLVDAAGNREVMAGGPRELDLSRGIELLEAPDRAVSRAEGDIHLYGNPHYWTDPENGRVIAQAIRDKLCAIDPRHEQAYHRNLREFLARLEQKIPEWRSRLAPYEGREVVGDHRAWPYLMRFLGLKMEPHLEPKPGIPPTPKQLEFLQQHITAQRIPAIVRAGYFPKGSAESLAKRTGAAVVLLCQSVGELPACSDYIAMLDYNVDQLVTVMGS